VKKQGTWKDAVMILCFLLAACAVPLAGAFTTHHACRSAPGPARRRGFRRRSPVASVHSASHNGAAASHNHDAIPQHVALICDGNARWASSKGLPAVAGHAAGADRLVRILATLQAAGVPTCTLFVFSTENWQRPAHEIADLLYVMEQTARQCRAQLRASQMRIRILGDLADARIPAGLREILTAIEEDTAASDAVTLTVCLAINYGGRRDILQAAKEMARVAAAASDPAAALEALTEDDLASYLSTNGLPDPDLVIRTSGEHRLSNFLLWNAAYAEIYFTDTLWPDFDEPCVHNALAWFAQRQRRFGARQVVQANGSSAR
jgi:undecaprenyl diphosphate synthase